MGTTYRGPWDVVQKAMLGQPTVMSGIRSLYRGFGTVLIGGTPGTMLYLCSYEWMKQTMGAADHSNDSSFLVHFGGGMFAEAIACIIYVPVDVLKERLQVSNDYRNSWHGVSLIVKNEGLAGIYRGYGATLASFGPFSALYFVLYEQTKSWAKSSYHSSGGGSGGGVVRGDDLPFSSIVMCSCTSGALASWLTSPLDMAKLRLQVHRSTILSHIHPNQDPHPRTSSSSTPLTMIQIMKDVLQKDGIRGLFRGAGARVLHFAPATTITMTTYETFRSLLVANHV